LCWPFSYLLEDFRRCLITLCVCSYLGVRYWKALCQLPTVTAGWWMLVANPPKALSTGSFGSPKEYFPNLFLYREHICLLSERRFRNTVFKI
jgi:hypothetical protein